PTDQEIGDEMGISAEKVREIVKVSQDPVSLETPIGEEEDSHLGDFVEDKEATSPSDAASLTMLRTEVEDILDTLTPRERRVLQRLTACAGPAGPIGGTPSSSAAIKSSTSSPLAAASTGAALGCRLPVVQWTQTAQGQVPSGGFISFPGGQFSPDPASEIIVDGSRYRSVAQPYLYGGGPGPGAYDLQMRRWLPPTPRNVSPDGSHYAYQEEFGTIHDV